jgi:RNA polymerase sigma factor (sigma-70 family)
MMTTGMTLVAASGDVELVNACLAGNREAFGQIVSRYQSLVCSLAYSATGSLSQSEDLAQETFLAAWKHLAELREPARLRAWLCGIARNLINNSLRTQGREPSHRAESLDEISESYSPEPLPVERAISKEEAEILWRSLERIPETYRVPLVLFYREHHSIQAVAQSLELTEEAVRQRLSRGRKLLQEEVLAFVEVALEKTSPGKAFTVAVVAALPIAVTSAKAASVGAAVAKGGAGVKSLISLGALSALGSSVSMLGAMLFSWKTLVDDSKSPRERKFMVRMAWYNIAFVIAPVAGFVCICFLSVDRPWVVAPASALLVLAFVANGIMGRPYVVRRRMEIRMEEGTLLPRMAEAMPGSPREVTRSKAFRRTIKLTIPTLLMFVGMGLALPWKHHWLRCAVVMAAQALLIVCSFRRTHRWLSFQVPPRLPSRLPAFMQKPFIRDSVNLLKIVLFVSFLLLFVYPGAAKSETSHPNWLDNPLCFLLAVFVVYAPFFADDISELFFGALRRIVPNWNWLRSSNRDKSPG